MKIILISHPDSFKGEYEIINLLFQEGLKYFHLRKPSFNRDDVEECIKNISEKFRDRIILHSCYDLCLSYNLKGVHIGSENSDHKIKAIHKSISLHSLEELASVKAIYNYVFLSPIFKSISKEGYYKDFNFQNLEKLLRIKRAQGVQLIALGGVSQENIEKVYKLGFSGFALHGAIWQAKNKVREFLKIKESCEKLINIECNA